MAILARINSPLTTCVTCDAKGVLRITYDRTNDVSLNHCVFRDQVLLPDFKELCNQENSFMFMYTY